MQMERRWSARKPLELNARLVCRRRRGTVVQQCRTRNFGLSGAFVWTALPPLTDDTEFELIFTRAAGSVVKVYRLRAHLARRSAYGVGLMFHEFDARTFRSLQELLFREEPSFDAVAHEEASSS